MEPNPVVASFLGCAWINTFETKIANPRSDETS
jgi:hypothetical protein